MPVLKHAHHNHPAQQAEDQFGRLGKTGSEPVFRAEYCCYSDVERPLGQADGAARLKQQWRRERHHQPILRLPPATDFRTG